MRGVVAASLLVGSLFVASPAHAEGQSARLLLIGDSVTHGRAGDITWRYRLWKTLESRHMAVDFVGPRQGEFNPAADDLNDTAHYPYPDFDQDHAATWGGSMSYRVGDFDLDQLVADYAPDVVINDEGYNDLSFFHLTPEQLVALMQQFVADVRAVNPAASIVIGQLPQHWVPGVPEYNQLLMRMAESLDTPGSRVLAAPAPADFTEYVDTYDPAHPTSLGEIKIAEEFASALAQLPLPAVPGPPAPTASYTGGSQLTATSRLRAVRLTFTTPADATRQVIWLRDRTVGGRWRAVATVSPATHRFRIGRLRSGHRYAVRLRAYRDDLASASYSNTARARAL